MATPTFTQIDPAFGHSGGKQLVRITGTNFELPTVPTSGYVGGDTPETVQVEIDGELCTEVKVWQATELTCLTPAYRGSPSVLNADPGLSVDITIRNIGPPIEEDTFAGEFAYRRADLTREDGPLRHIERTLIREMRRQIIDNVVPATTVDFDSSTGDALDIVELAEVPAISLFGPTIREDRFRRESEKPTTDDEPSLEYTKTRLPRVSMLTYTMTVTARDKGELLHLDQEVLDFFNRNPQLSVDIDTTDPSAGRVEFEMFLDEGPARGGSANSSNIFASEATFTIHGISIDGDAGTQIEWGHMVDEVDDIENQAEGM